MTGKKSMLILTAFLIIFSYSSNAQLQTEGLEPVVIELTPHNLPIIIPAGGGSFVFDVEINNTTGETRFIDIWLDVTLPGGVHYPILVRNNIAFPAGMTLVRPNLTQMVPGTAAAGIYTYNGYVRDHFSWEVLSSDNFNFEKLSGSDVPAILGWELLGWYDDLPYPELFLLRNPYPNPFNSSTMVTFDLPEGSEVSLKVFDVKGREAAVLWEGYTEAGVHSTGFSGEGISSGVYFIRLEANNEIYTRKVVLIR